MFTLFQNPIPPITGTLLVHSNQFYWYGSKGKLVIPWLPPSVTSHWTFATIEKTAILWSCIQIVIHNIIMYFTRFWNQLRGLTRKSFIQMRKRWFANLFVVLLPGTLWIETLLSAIVIAVYSTMSKSQSSKSTTPISIEKLGRCVPLDR